MDEATDGIVIDRSADVEQVLVGGAWWHLSVRILDHLQVPHGLGQSSMISAWRPSVRVPARYSTSKLRPSTQDIRLHRVRDWGGRCGDGSTAGGALGPRPLRTKGAHSPILK